MHIGDVIHKLRKQRSMTLQELSKRSDVAVATLSRIENGRMSGTITSHMHIADAMGVRLPDLYRDLDPLKKEIDITAKKSRPNVSVGDKGVATELLAAKVQNKRMIPFLITIGKGCGTAPEEDLPGTEKFLYVLDGKVQILIAGEQYTISKGDTLYFESSSPHQFKNIASVDVRILSIVSQGKI